MTTQSRLKKVESHLARLLKEVAGLRREIAAPARKSSNQPHPLDADRLAAYLALSPAMAGDEILRHLLQCAMRVAGGGGAGLTLWEPRKRRLVFRAAVGDGADGMIGQEVPLKGSRHGLAFATGEVQSATPLYSKVEKKARARFRNVLVAPLLAQGEAVGTISVVNKQDADHFTPQDMAAIKLFADLAALVVRQRVREQILRSGLLTGKAPDLAATFTTEDQELLALFETLTRLKNTRPSWLPLLRQFAKGLENLS